MKTRSLFLALALGLSAVTAVVQAQTLSTTLAAQVEAAVNNNDTAALQTLVANNPTLAAPIAQAAAVQAQAIVATNPAAAAAAASFANNVANTLPASSAS